MCSDSRRWLTPDVPPDGVRAVPMPADLRKACYGVVRLAEAEIDTGVRRILAAVAFALAQEAQLQARTDETDKAPSA